MQSGAFFEIQANVNLCMDRFPMRKDGKDKEFLNRTKDKRERGTYYAGSDISGRNGETVKKPDSE